MELKEELAVKVIICDFIPIFLGLPFNILGRGNLKPRFLCFDFRELLFTEQCLNQGEAEHFVPDRFTGAFPANTSQGKLTAQDKPTGLVTQLETLTE